MDSDSQSRSSTPTDTTDSLLVTYIGHATLLLRFADAVILTDPNFDPKLGAILPRVSAPGIEIAELPRIDAIVLTHAHADHLSFRSLHALPDDIPIYAPTAVAQWLRRSGFPSARAIVPGRSVQIGSVSVTSRRASHSGARYVMDHWRGEAIMYLLDDGKLSVLFTGDTAICPNVFALANQLAPRRLDVALLPIGYAPKWKEYFFRRGHLTAADALSLFVQLDARMLIPFHWGTFRHITSGPYDAIRVLRRLLETHHRGSDVRVLEPGDTLTVSPAGE